MMMIKLETTSDAGANKHDNDDNEQKFMRIHEIFKIY